MFRPHLALNVDLCLGEICIKLHIILTSISRDMGSAAMPLHDFVSYHLSLGLEPELNVEATIDAIGASGLITLKANLVGGV